LFLTLLAVVVAGAVVARMRAYEGKIARGELHADGTPVEVAAAPDAVHRARSGAIVEGDPSISQTTASSDPGVIVERDGSVAPTTSNATRAQRFHELLSAPLPSTSSAEPRPAAPPAPESAPPAAKPEPPSALARLTAPIVNAVRAITGNNPAPLKSATAAQTQTPVKENQKPVEPAQHESNDKTSDSAAPQLLAAEFSPPQVQDGQDALLILAANDDLSGIRNISGSVTSPTGKALQGFAAQRDGETRYVARIQIPRDAEEGTWRVNFISLSDNASNTANMTFAQSPILQNALLRVQSSRPDSTPPAVKRVWLERPSMTAGEKNTVFVHAVDDKSGVQLVTGVMLSPTGLARLGFGCHLTENDIWACELVTPKKLDCGDWKLEQLQLQDKANNMGTERGPNVTAVQLSIMSEACDSTPPDMRAFTLDPTVIGNVEQGTIHVTAIVNDDNSGVASISGQAAGPAQPGQQPPRLFFSLRPTGDNQTWVGDIVVPKLAAKGTWSIIWVQVLDDARNLKSFSRNDPVLADAAFLVR
jgi:hypothetical protein